MIVPSEEDVRLHDNVSKMRDETVEEMVQLAEEFGRGNYRKELQATIMSFFNKMFDKYEFIEKNR